MENEGTTVNATTKSEKAEKGSVPGPRGVVPPDRPVCVSCHPSFVVPGRRTDSPVGRRLVQDIEDCIRNVGSCSPGRSGTEGSIGGL